MHGVAEVLRVLRGDRRLIRLGLEPENPLQLERAPLGDELGRLMALSRGAPALGFFIDGSEAMGEIMRRWEAEPLPVDPLDPLRGGAMRKRAAAALMIPNLSCVLAKVADVAARCVGPDAGPRDILGAVAQNTATFVLYWFWKCVRTGSGAGFVEGLRSCQGSVAAATIDRIDRSFDPFRDPTRGIEAHVFGCDPGSFVALELAGAEGVWDTRVNVPAEALFGAMSGPRGRRGPRPLEAGILERQWLRYFVPVIAARQVVESAFAGRPVGRDLDRVGLHMAECKHVGPP